MWVLVILEVISASVKLLHYSVFGANPAAFQDGKKQRISMLPQHDDPSWTSYPLFSF